MNLYFKVYVAKKRLHHLNCSGEYFFELGILSGLNGVVARIVLSLKYISAQLKENFTRSIYVQLLKGQ